jgi:nitrile hydratase subunit alpha
LYELPSRRRDPGVQSVGLIGPRPAIGSAYIRCRIRLWTPEARGTLVLCGGPSVLSRQIRMVQEDVIMTSHDPHSHDHDHEHPHDHSTVPSDPALRVKALESLLIEKGLVEPAALDAIVEYYEHKVGPRNGARVVARAWTDPAYKTRLLTDATAAISELGYSGRQGEHMVVVENTPTVHNMVVCTLCSCYPWPVLGLPPAWYKSAAYRSRSVIEPRVVLREFGLNLPDEIEVRVWDSTAEVRYLVLPQRPAGTDAMTEEQLTALATRDSMIGVAQVPAQ